MITELSASKGFESRHIGPSPQDVSAMLQTIGVSSLDELIAQTVPDDIRQRSPLDLGPALSEMEALEKARQLAARNIVLTSLIGQGYYGTILPPVIQRNILENPAWYTAYTPYQPEISQGRLEALLNFQTMIADLTALEIANASLLDEATAAAEAMAMAKRISQSGRTVFFADRDCHPQTLAVLKTRAEGLGWRIATGDPMQDMDPELIFGAIFPYPGTFGAVRDFREPISRLKAAGAISVLAADPLALTLLKPPGELGADIAIGSVQRLGLPMGFGGPHAAYIATKDVYKRALPGRLVGVSVDSRGNEAYRLALQTREQHIRREKATSNICTAAVLMAVIASMYAVYHGPDGLKAIARRIHKTASSLKTGLLTLGWNVRPSAFFDTITVEVGEHREAILRRAVENGINLRDIPSCHGRSCIGISCDETTTIEIIQKVWCAFGESSGASAKRVDELDCEDINLPANLHRKSSFLTHRVFHQFRSETELLRYMRRLADRDLALDRSMIPLGSCTMKLSATAEMMPLTWPEFANLHPFVPASQAQGYAAVIAELDTLLRKITGYDAISFQPNSGAQGEYAGLLAIRGYHRSRGCVRARHEPCLCPYGRHGGRSGELRWQRKRRPIGPPRQGGGTCGQVGGDYDHVSVDARRVRARDSHDLRYRARAWRAGLPRRGELERAGRIGAARRLRRRCQPRQFAQDVLSAPWRRRAGYGSDRREGTSRAVSSRASGAGERADVDRFGGRSPLRIGIDPAHCLDLLSADGRQGTDRGHQGRHPQRELCRQAPASALPASLQGAFQTCGT